MSKTARRIHKMKETVFQKRYAKVEQTLQALAHQIPHPMLDDQRRARAMRRRAKLLEEWHALQAEARARHNGPVIAHQRL